MQKKGMIIVIFSLIIAILILKETTFDAIIGYTKDVVEIALTVITGVVAIFGISYLRKLKEKKAESIVGFCIHLKIRIVEILRRIEDFPQLLYFLCDDDSLTNLNTEEMHNDFCKLVKETLKFIKDNNNQVPIVTGWTENYTAFISFLSIIDSYDYNIDGEQSYHKFTENSELIKFVEDNKKNMKNLVKMIDIELTAIERK